MKSHHLSATSGRARRGHLLAAGKTQMIGTIPFSARLNAAATYSPGGEVGIVPLGTPMLQPADPPQREKEDAVARMRLN